MIGAEQESSGAIATLVLITLFDIVVSLFAFSFALLALINLNLLAYHVLHVALWFLWLFSSYRLLGLSIRWPTAALTGLSVILDTALFIFHAITGWNCFVAGVDCPALPDTGATIIILSIFELIYVFTCIFALLALITLIRIEYSVESTNAYKNSIKTKRN